MTVCSAKEMLGDPRKTWLLPAVVLIGLPPLLFAAQVFVLYRLTAHSGSGTELAGFGFLILSPLMAPFLIVSLATGLVASRAVYRRKPRRH